MSYGTQRQTVLKVLLDALSPDDVEIIAALLDGSIDDISPPNATRNKRILDLIIWAERRSKEEALIRTAMEQIPTNRELKLVGPTVLRALAASTSWYVSPDPLETCIVGSDQAFVDRSELRQRLQQLMPANGWRALIVHGEERSGRSFTHELISFVIGDAEDKRIAHVDLSTALNLDSGDLVRRMALQLTLNTKTIPVQQEQAARWNDELRDWLVGQVEASGRTSWLIVDAIDKARPSDAIMDLLWKLAAAAKIRPRLRVVLLGCSEPVPGDVKALRENIEPITKKMVEDYFGLFLQHKRSAPDKRVARKATRLALASVPPSGSDRLETLQKEVAKVARAIAEGEL